MIKKCPECGIEKTEENTGYEKFGIVLGTHGGDIFPDIRLYYCENCGYMYDIDYEKQENKMKAIIKLCKNTYNVFINDELKADYSTLHEAQSYVAGIDLKRHSNVLRCKAFYQNASKWID